jgi:ribosomal protein L20
LNRKALSELAISDPGVFDEIVEAVQAARAASSAA